MTDLDWLNKWESEKEEKEDEKARGYMTREEMKRLVRIAWKRVVEEAKRKGLADQKAKVLGTRQNP